MIEYVALGALIAVVAIGGMSFVGQESHKTFNEAGERLQGALGGNINPDGEKEGGGVE